MARLRGPSGGRPERQPLGDLLVAAPLADQTKHLPFALGEHQQQDG
jgi:hypothetical protein